MLRKLLMVMAVVTILACPTFANVWSNYSSFDLGTITLVSAAQGGGPVTFTLDDPPNGKGVIGWGLYFDYDEDPVNASWASDIKMTMTSPGGAFYEVGGFSGVLNDWDFQGGVSTDPGPYADDPVDGFDNSNNFPWKDDIQDKGLWVVTFENDWNSTFAAVQTMSNTEFRLYKIPEPGSLGLLALAGLSLTVLRRRSR